MKRPRTISPSSVPSSDAGWTCPLRSSETFWTHLLNSWSAKFSHSAGARFRFWNVSRMFSGRVSESIFFNLSFCSFLEWSSIGRLYSRYPKWRLIVRCSGRPTAVAVCLGNFLSPGFLLFVSFSDFFNATSSCVLGPGIELGPAVFGFARFMARFRPPPDSMFFEIMTVWLSWNRSTEFTKSASSTAHRSSSSKSVSSKLSDSLQLLVWFRRWTFAFALRFLLL